MCACVCVRVCLSGLCTQFRLFYSGGNNKFKPNGHHALQHVCPHTHTHTHTHSHTHTRTHTRTHTLAHTLAHIHTHTRARPLTYASCLPQRRQQAEALDGDRADRGPTGRVPGRAHHRHGPGGATHALGHAVPGENVGEDACADVTQVRHTRTHTHTVDPVT